MNLSPEPLLRIIRNALDEDLGWGDITTDALIPSDLQARAKALVKQEGVLAGIEVFAQTFRTLDPQVSVTILQKDGCRISPGDVVAQVEGPAGSLLRAERTALNFLQRLSGIATETAAYTAQVADLPVRLIDTRKTTPGLRLLEKYAVRVGGAHNHRFNLSDGVLIKENHLAALRSQGIGMKEAIATVRQKVPHTLKIEVEVLTVAQAQEALEAGADVILLDNMAPELMRQVVQRAAGRALIEASGRVRRDNLRAIAETGVDLISSGALTHSYRALDISLEFEVP